MDRTVEPAADVDAAETVADLIGETPLLRLDSVADNCFGKLEAANPYSVKDRIARAILDAAERAGALEPGGTVVESTSGNTGIGLAAVSAARGYDCVLTMPASMSTERRRLLRALGADLELTPAEDGMTGANERAEAIAADREDAIVARQFENEANPAVHRETTGPEIWAATDGAVVAGVGTGGTITGISEFVKEEQGKHGVTSVAVEPAASPTLSECSTGGHDIQGIGPGFVPDILRTDLVDEVRAVEAADARNAARKLGRTDCWSVSLRVRRSPPPLNTRPTIRTNWSSSFFPIPANVTSRPTSTSSTPTSADSRSIRTVSVSVTSLVSVSRRHRWSMPAVDSLVSASRRHEPPGRGARRSREDFACSSGPHTGRGCRPTGRA